MREASSCHGFDLAIEVFSEEEELEGDFRGFVIRVRLWTRLRARTCCGRRTGSARRELLRPTWRLAAKVPSMTVVAIW